MSARVSRIQNQMIQSWDVLSTMTPAEYLGFRGKLGRASGFQSYQYRTIEFLRCGQCATVHGRLHFSFYDEQMPEVERETHETQQKKQGESGGQNNCAALPPLQVCI